MALAASMWGGGAVSGGSASLPAVAFSATAAGVADAVWAPLFAPAGLFCAQPRRPETIKQKIRLRAVSATVACLPCVAFMNQCDDLAAAASRRARLRLGCTSQATAMLTTYSATMGAAKMHIFRISVVGVTMAAMMKMIRME